MATLKIATNVHHYITNIKTLTRKQGFAVPKESRGLSPERMEEAVLAVALGGEGAVAGKGCTIHFGAFEGQDFGLVLELERENGERQCWIVPEHATFLIADNGRTIDRI